MIIVAISPLGAAGGRPPSSLDFTPELDHGLLGAGRQAYRERADLSRAQDAYDLFKRYAEQHPDDPTAAWHLSLACYYMGKRVEQDPERRKSVFAEGRERAEHALTVDETCGPCHLLAAINHALWAREVGIVRTIVGLPTVKRHLARAAELDPAFGGAAAFRVQANIAQALPRVFGGGKGKARGFIEEAIAVAPNEHLNYEVLAFLLLGEYRDPEAALAVARRGLAVPAPGPEYVESLDAIDELQKIVNAFGGTEATGG